MPFLNVPLVFHPNELRKPAAVGKPDIESVPVPEIRPFELTFGLSGSEIRKILGKPEVVIVDDLFLEGREICYYQRTLGSYPTVTQIHLIKDRLRLVYEYIQRPAYAQDLIFSGVLKTMGLEVPSQTGQFTDLYLEDSKGNYLVVEEDFTLRLRFQDKEPLERPAVKKAP